MPMLTDWLEMPSATPEKGPSLFDPPPLRSIGAGSGREGKRQNIEMQRMQKMAMYQSAMRKMEQDRQAEDEARAVIPVLKTLDPRQPDYLDRRTSLITQFPLAASHPAVGNVLGQHDNMIQGIANQQRHKEREEQEIGSLVAEDPIMRDLYETEARNKGPEAAKDIVRRQMYNDAQAERLIKLGYDPTDPKVAAGFEMSNGLLNKRRIDMIEAKKKLDEDKRRKSEAPNSIKEKYLASKRDGFQEDVDLYESMFPSLKDLDSKGLPATVPSATKETTPQKGVGKTSAGITFKRED